MWGSSGCYLRAHLCHHAGVHPCSAASRCLSVWEPLFVLMLLACMQAGTMTWSPSRAGYWRSRIQTFPRARRAPAASSRSWRRCRARRMTSCASRAGASWGGAQQVHACPISLATGARGGAYGCMHEHAGGGGQGARQGRALFLALLCCAASVLCCCPHGIHPCHPLLLCCPASSVAW